MHTMGVYIQDGGSILRYSGVYRQGRAEFLPSPSGNKKLRALLVTLETVESVSMQLQYASVAMWEVRVLFDALLEQNPALRRYLGAF